MSDPAISMTESRRAVDRLLPSVYAELRNLARHYLNNERRNHSLQPTALVHEAYVKLMSIERVDWRGRTYFFAVAANQMRRVLVEHARAARAEKRGGRLQTVTLNEAIAPGAELSVDLLALDQALSGLAALNPRQATVAESRLFAGMTDEEIAHAVGVTDRTVRRDWLVARAWLARELASRKGGSR